MFGLSRTLMWVCAALVLALGCSSTYNTDIFRIDGGDDTDIDAAGGTIDAASGQPDAGGSQIDASGNQPDAAADCGGIGQPCCFEGIDSCNGDFIECADGMCQECGQDGMDCCRTSPFCQGDPLLECPLGLACIL